MPATGLAPSEPSLHALDLPLLLATVDESGRVVEANDLLAEALALPRDELPGRSFVELVVAPPDRDGVATAIATCGERPSRARGLLATRERTPMVWHCRRRGGRVVIVGTDDGERVDAEQRLLRREAQITETERAAQRALFESGQHFEALVAASPVGVFKTDLEGRCTFSNRRWRSITGVDEAQAKGRHWLTLVGPEDRDGALAEWSRTTRVLSSYRRELRFRRADGFDTWVLAQTVPLRSADGKVVGHIGTLTDITEGKLAQEVVRRERTLLRALLQAFPGYVTLYAPDGSILDANRAALEHVAPARKQGDALWTHPLLSRSEPLRRRFEALWRRALAGETVRFEFASARHDGGVLELDASFTPIRDETGEVIHVAAFATDVSERNRTLARLNDAQRLAALGSWEQDYRTGESSWSDELYRILGLPPQGAPATFATYLAAVHPDDRAACEAMRARMPECRAPFSVTRRIVHGSGEIRHVREDYDPTLVEGRLARMTGTVQDVTAQVQDVTERVKAERELQRMNDLFLNLLESTPDFIFVKDEGHRYQMANRSLARALGREPRALVGVLDDELWPPSTVAGDGEIVGFHAEDDRVLGGELLHDQRRVLDFPDGSHRVMDVIKAPLRDAEGRVYGVLGYCRDVTERQALIDTQQRLIAEKEVLLREIHHRVKNNLQIISGLLHFQAKKAHHPSDVAAFSEARARLLAMTIIHDKLYQSSDLSRVELGDYVRSLVGTLSQLAMIGRVDVLVDAATLHLPMELALSCGMIISELVTNAFKYAFPDGRAGRLFVRVLRDGEAVTLSVRDDGVGFPDGFDPQRVSSFGWQLVRNLAERLDASLGVEASGGAHVRITFAGTDASPRS